MNIVIAFIVGLAGTLVLGAVFRFAVELFVADHRTARIAAFCLALGYAMGRGPYGDPATAGYLPPVAAAVGSIAALTALWYWLIKRPAREDEN